jgi:hypothetical protein
VTKSGHKGYENTTIPDKCPQPVFVEDRWKNSNTDNSVDVNVETNMESGTYHFFVSTRTHQDMIVWINLLLQWFGSLHPHC